MNEKSSKQTFHKKMDCFARVYPVARNDEFFLFRNYAKTPQQSFFVRNDELFYSAKTQKNKHRNFTISYNFNCRFILYIVIKNRLVRFCPNLTLVRLFIAHYNLLS